MLAAVNLAELEETLSRPTPTVVETLRGIDGDVVILGAGGKMGPSLARMAKRAIDLSGSPNAVHAVSRYTDQTMRAPLEDLGVHTIACDLLERSAVRDLPEAAAVIFMAGTKFGTSTDRSTTWALNSLLPGIVAERYAGVPTVVFSSGNVYPFVADGQAATEEVEPSPVGEYAWSVLARERIFEHFAATAGSPLLIYRLNYASELRYGVPLDIARKVLSQRPINLAMGSFNTIWQGDANAIALSCVDLASTPTKILNVTGPETVSVRSLALRFGELLDRQPIFEGAPEPTALLSDSSQACEHFGQPSVNIETLTEWIAAWLLDGGPTLDKPTHYEVRDGTF
ncbi:MAG: NAD-dependent epimerase/dehydratase family protein [Planctomycetota bacterium]|nr:NAD-dependent epimerase/dehydratase family protein [Planctomycetota bacterium]